ncbi:dihydrofolate reductase family protein [Terrimonas sp. NA20]|uniref:Dihydrofolate reductase family protein n=1 Tax=Terrimonas ginsenosidimutans TaxID=2908004 RepID=A0ABS9KW15_9BACT|nr:dihydrofolate reductase family protein [Terrimonas ginsenosidimutans]MCG2616552.1 dihydrofolate reductase family protein [Terrimonas ginsenosidimutans]
MRKLIAAMNMTLDGFCDHTAGIADKAIHQHYADLIQSADTIIYGRITYLLMENYWPDIVNNPTGDQSTDNFANAMDKINKLVFSHTLKKLRWDNARIATRSIKEEIEDLKSQTGGDILVGSPGLIVGAMNLHLVDELQLSIHPTIEGKGLSLFKKIKEQISLKLLRTKTFDSGIVTFYYRPEYPGVK